MSDDLTIAYQIGVEDMRQKLHKQADEIERLRAENEKLRDAYDTDALTISYNLGYTCGKDIAKDEIEKLHREAAIRIDQIEREQEAHLRTIADYNRAAVKIEKLREALKPFADAVTDEYSWKYDINSDDFRAAAAAIRESGE
jgi:hypothetical protein